MMVRGDVSKSGDSDDSILKLVQSAVGPVAKVTSN